MILSRRFEVDLFICPPHGPVYAPREFCGAGGSQVDGLFLSGFIVSVGHSPFAVPSKDGGGVFSSKIAEHADGVPVVGEWCGSVPVEDLFDFVPFFQGCSEAFCIEGAAVSLCLVEVFGFYSYDWEKVFNGFFIGFRVVFMCSGCVWNKCDGFSQVCFQAFRVGHVLGNFSEDVVIVP